MSAIPSQFKQPYFGTEVLDTFDEYLAQTDYSKVFFLVDEHTHEYCLPKLLPALSQLDAYEILEVEAGEQSKSPEVLMQLYFAMSELGADRHALLVNLGGGVISDLGGFLASTYKRGIAFVHFPTSLLGMVDASIGGKTGIDLGAYKNQVGSFALPEAIYIYPDFLESLSPDHRRNGWAEMFKHGLIADADYYAELTAHFRQSDLPTEAQIKRSIEIKSDLVRSDFRESGQRKKLNFGHSLGHALESYALENGSELLHGDAVVWGIIAELQLSCAKLKFDAAVAKQIEGDLLEFYGQQKPQFEPEALLPYLTADKKNRAGSLRFCLLRRLGEAEVDVELSPEECLQALRYIQTL